MILIGIKEYSPKITIDVATLTGAMVVALGSQYCGTFSTCPTLFDRLKVAGLKTGDRMWQMPLSPDYGADLKSSVADIKNSGGRSGGSCSAAHFLSQFVDMKNTLSWAHIDMAGVMETSSPSSYFRKKGMTGRPTRTLIEYLSSK